MLTNPNPQGHHQVHTNISIKEINDSLLSAISQYVLVKDTKKRFVWVSDGFCKFIGKTRNSIIGKTDFDFFRSDLALSFQADDDKILKGQVQRLEAQEEENALLVPQSLIRSSKTVIRTKVPVVDGNKEIVGVLCTFQDITNQKKLQNRQLKLFVHDVPKPLLIFRDSYLYELRDIANSINDNDSKSLHNIANKIEHAIEFTLSCCSAYGFLGSSTDDNWLPEDKWSEFKLSEIANLVVSLLEPNTQCTFKVSVRHECIVSSDKYKIITMVYSLAHNAVAATRGLIKPGIIEICLEIKADLLMIVVTDNGIGIRGESKTKIYNEGYSTFGSSGIGLFIVNKFALASGGYVYQEDVIKENSVCGCTFRIMCKKFKLIKAK